MAKSQNAPTTKPSSARGCLISILIIAALFYFLRDCNLGSDDLSVDAEVMAEQFVKDRLKAPSTADFSSESSKDLGDKIYLVTGYVDSENSFSAKIRSSFTVKLQYSGNNNWNLLDISINDFQ
jgi:hypothetical protein